METNKENIEALKFLTNRYAENVWKHTSITLIALGWLLSSTQIHELFSSNPNIKYGITLLFFGLFSIHWFVNRPIYKKIKDLESQVSASFGQDISDAYTVKGHRFFLNELMILFVTTFGVLFIWLYKII